jgi:hypothetical protein
VALGAIAALWLTATPALVPNVRVSDDDRRAYLLQQLATEESDTAVWYWAWGLGWVGTTAFQFASWPWTPVADRPALVAWGISSGLGAILTLALRPEALGARKRAEEGNLDEIWVKVHDDEVFARSIWQQLGVLVLNVAPFLVVGLAYHRWDQWPTMLGGLVLSEAQVFSFPQLLRRFGVR